MSITLSALQKQRRDTAANWTAANPTLLAGEIGIESDTNKIKIGTGSTAWTSLAYTPWSQLSAYPIVNADVASNAEIAVSKLADGSARQLLQTAANGNDVEWTSNIDVPGTLDVTGAATFDAAVTIQGDLTVNGTTTTIDTQHLIVEDKNVVIGQVTTPSDVTADGGGITLKGTTDKTINWVDATDAWTFSEHVNIASAKEYRIAGTKVLDATSLGSGVVSSSLTSVGTIGTGAWQGTVIGALYGGTGQTTYTNGQLLIGNTTGNTLTKATLTAGSNISITNGNGSISIAGTDTTYTAGDGLDLVGTTFSADLKANGGLVIESTELAVDLSASSITGTLGVGDGGTGQTSYTDGQLLIGNTTGNTLSKSTLTAGTGISITNGSGSVTIASTVSGGLPTTGGTLTGDLLMDNQSDVRFGEATVNGSNYVGFQAPASISVDVLWTLPSADATVAGQVLASNASGTLSWATAGGGFASGTAMLFVQTAAPTGWTKSTTHDNKALRVVSGTASSGGTTAFTSVFASRTPSGTVGATTLTEAQIPSHTHSFTASVSSVNRGLGGSACGTSPAGSTTGATGGGGSHDHGFTGTAMDFAVQYVDVIIATKD